MIVTTQDDGTTAPVKQEGASASAVPEPQRQRRMHTRSREGCLTCRKRHKRCDETKPTCINCSTTSRECVYSQATVPLRERRATERADVPGLQQPWKVTPSSVAEDHAKNKDSKPAAAAPSRSVARSAAGSPPRMPATNWQKILGKSADPFGTFSIDMPLESTTLLQYFHQAVKEQFGDPRKDSLKSVIHDPGALRSAVLLASVHYAWSTGQLAHFETTFFFHKVENIRLVNKKIQDTMRTPKEFCECINEVATLAMLEALLMSNDVAAESHLQGLIALLESRSATCAESPGAKQQKSLDEELCDRYVLFVSMLVQGVKTRNADLLDTMDNQWRQPDHQLEVWIRERMSGLKVICMIPHLLSPPSSSVVPRPIEVLRGLEVLRAMTRACELKHRWYGTKEYDKVRDILWSEDSASQMWYIGVANHTDSLLAAEEEPKLPSAWSAMYATVAAYENCVIEAINAGLVMDQRLLRHHLTIVDTDLRQTRECLEKDPASSPTSQSNLWLWKAYTGAFSLGCVDAPLDARNKALKRSFECHLRDAARALGIEKWDEARARLEIMAWPSRAYKEARSIQTWYRATLGASASSKDTWPDST